MSRELSIDMGHREGKLLERRATSAAAILDEEVLSAPHAHWATADGATSRPRVICVDLDGTLIAGDLFWEAVLRLVLTRPWSLVQLPLWLLKGRAYLKRQVASRVPLDPGTLSYRTELIEQLTLAREQGHHLVLATGSDELYARQVSEHLGIFAELFASDGRTNLTGSRKAARLRAEYGAGEFSYVGNDWVDLPVWAAARVGTIVAGPARLADRLRSLGRLEQVLGTAPRRSRAMWRALRPYQWIKNVLLFVPLITSHRLLEWPLVGRALLAFAAFSFCASGIYVLNDLVDIHSDRQHPEKRRRPFAAGELSVPTGLLMFASLLAAGLTVGLAVGSAWFLAVMGIYVLVTTAYSARLKREPVADVFVLAGLYVLRVVAGGVATGIVLSTWLLAFALFVFLSLAYLKRFIELTANDGRMPGRGYVAEDRLWLQSVGTCAGYLAVLVLALYVTSADVMLLYRSPQLLWLLCPVMLFWVTRTWFRAGRGRTHHDPVMEALKDPVSYGCAITAGAILLISL